MNIKWVVLDDDPTGVQTVHDIAVYTDWTKETFLTALQAEENLFYVLTNSRGLTAAESAALHTELMENLAAACHETGARVQVISRSDSTLRGHFPLETDLLRDALKKHLGLATDGIIMAPFFEAGSRLTMGDVHYVKQGGTLVPAAETEFAKDATFGYTHSNLKEYIAEKTGQPQDVLSVTLEMLKNKDTEAVRKILEEAQGRYIIVNATEPSDLETFAKVLHAVIDKGYSFVYRTAADFVKAVGGISTRPLLTRAEMTTTAGAGIVIVGSHTKKTTAQLERLKDLPGLHLIPFDSDRVLEDALDEETDRVRALAEADMRQGITPVVYTGRSVLVLPDDTKEAALERTVKISNAVTRIVADLAETPAFIVAKGGITSSDVGVKALHVRRAWVLGQIRPGIPVWQCGQESRFPGVPYVIFPGNVGEEGTLRSIMEEFLG